MTMNIKYLYSYCECRVHSGSKINDDALGLTKRKFTTYKELLEVLITVISFIIE